MSPLQVYCIEGHPRPCLGVMFAPWDPSLIVYNEETKHVYTRDYSRAQEKGVRMEIEGTEGVRGLC